MQPIVQTLEVMAELDLEDDCELLRVLSGHSEQMHALVPDVVGIECRHARARPHASPSRPPTRRSPSSTSHPASSTRRSTSEEHVLDEGRWQRLAQDRPPQPPCPPTLTLPILAGGSSKWFANRVDLYAGSWDAFTDLHEDIAFVFDAWAPAR